MNFRAARDVKFHPISFLAPHQISARKSTQLASTPAPAPAAEAAASRLLRLPTTSADTPTPAKYKSTMGAITTNIVNASGVGVTIAAIMEITRIEYFEFTNKNFGVTIPNSVRKKIRIR